MSSIRVEPGCKGVTSASLCRHGRAGMGRLGIHNGYSQILEGLGVVWRKENTSQVGDGREKVSERGGCVYVLVILPLRDVLIRDTSDWNRWGWR